MMSDNGLQRIIAAALTNGEVLATLLTHPVSLASRFGLTVLERRFLVGARPRDLQHFASLVEAWKANRLVAEDTLADDCAELARILAWARPPTRNAGPILVPALSGIKVYRSIDLDASGLSIGAGFETGAAERRICASEIGPDASDVIAVRLGRLVALCQLRKPSFGIEP